MISSYNSIPQAVAANGLVNFNIDRIQTGCTVTHTDGSPTFQLNKPGYYYITFNAVVTNAATGNITAQLQNGTVAIPGAVSTISVAADTDIGTLAFATIVKVPPSCCALDNTANLTIINSGVAATYNVANINITKLC